RINQGPSDCNNITVYVNGQTYYNWTTGSIILNSQQNGVSSVSIRYSVPALGTTTAAASSTAGSSAGGFVTETTEQTVSITQILAGETKTMIFTDTNLGVSSVDITAKNTLNNIELKIGTLSALPSDISIVVGEVYKYLQFTPTKISETDLSTAKIKFKVTNSWLTDNNIDPDTVALNRWITRWNKLPTVKTSEDSTYTYYEAETSGFSYFAITGTQFAAPVEDTTATEEIIEPLKETNWMVIGIIVVILIIGFYTYSNKHKKERRVKSKN
ncbi:MAG: PGF-pre-PGF domain-containing protein, partial [Nanoarchaeota archaeon]|nr:PGF-pre-PGF domain-containing protein [Nanoarchaeota archaeon]